MVKTMADVIANKELINFQNSFDYHVIIESVLEPFAVKVLELFEMLENSPITNINLRNELINMFQIIWATNHPGEDTEYIFASIENTCCMRYP